MTRKSVQNLLVFRFGQIGDTIAALPSLWALRTQFPDARIVVLSEISVKKNHLPPEAILPQIGLVDGFEKYPGGASTAHFFVAWRRVRQLRRQGFFRLVYLVPSTRSKKWRLRDLLFFRLCGMQQMLATNGFAENPWPRLTDGLPTVVPAEADSLLERLRLDGLTVPSPGHGCMELCLTKVERQQAAKWWRKNGYPEASSKWVAICPGAKLSSKLWPWERYVEVVRYLISNHGVFPVVVGGAEDREIGNKMVAIWKSGLCAAGELSVRESAALMENARLYLGNDTGTMHLAAAVGVPCVAIFSARDWPGRWSPYGLGHKALRFDVPCAGCRLEICDTKLKCLTGISATQVYQACVEVLIRRNQSRDVELANIHE